MECMWCGLASALMPFDKITKLNVMMKLHVKTRFSVFQFTTNVLFYDILSKKP